jgi:hypothetical protein
MLHRTFDYYEFIAVTVTLETGQKLINLLEADHALRQKFMDEDFENYSRRALVSIVVSLCDQFTHSS